MNVEHGNVPPYWLAELLALPVDPVLLILLDHFAPWPTMILLHSSGCGAPLGSKTWQVRPSMNEVGRRVKWSLLDEIVHQISHSLSNSIRHNKCTIRGQASESTIKVFRNRSPSRIGR